MAKISTVTDTTMFQVRKFLGMNENPDGDTRLRLGEAAEMRNWCVTQNGSLQIRPGTELVRKFGARSNGDWVGTKIDGMWYGYLYNGYKLVVATGGKIYDVDYSTTIDTGVYSNEHEGEFPVTELTGSVSTLYGVDFFAYQGYLYILDGVSYKKWDGVSAGISNVDGYVPVTMVGCNCADGSGTTMEQLNLLTGKRKVKFTVKSSDIVNDAIEIIPPERPKVGNLSSVYDNANGVEYLSSGNLVITTTSIDGSMYVTKLKMNKPSGGSLPQGPNVVTLTYDMEDGYTSEVTSMRHWEFFNGANDNRVFLYGNGTNTCIYSGLTEQGQPTAEYFPAMNQIQVGEQNTPITSMIRHFARLICYKKNSTYSISYDTMTLEDGSVVPGFYMTPVNRSIGNEAVGQVRLMQNNPVALHSGNAYVWKSSASQGNLTFDERQAQIISDRVENTLKSFTLSNCYCFDHDYNTEYYICGANEILVYNYGNNVWYRYTNLKVRAAVEIDHTLYLGMDDGSIRRFTRNAKYDYREPRVYEVFDGTTELTRHGWTAEDEPYKTFYVHARSGGGFDLHFCYIKDGFPYADIQCQTMLEADTPIIVEDGRDPIDAYWRSGSLSFDRDWKRKQTLRMWVGVLPENNSLFTITEETDRRADYPEKQIIFGQAGFGSIDFNDFNFGALRVVQIKRVKVKIKKYVFYRLIFESLSKENTATIVSTDIQVRYTTNAK